MENYSHHHDNGYVLNRSSMDIDLFNTNLLGHVPSDTTHDINNVSLGRTDGAVHAQTVLDCFNSFQANAPFTAHEKGVHFLGEHISLKNGTFCPLFSHDTTSF
jgi:hypothetical protein